MQSAPAGEILPGRSAFQSQLSGNSGQFDLANGVCGRHDLRVVIRPAGEGERLPKAGELEYHAQLDRPLVAAQVRKDRALPVADALRRHHAPGNVLEVLTGEPERNVVLRATGEHARKRRIPGYHRGRTDNDRSGAVDNRTFGYHLTVESCRIGDVCLKQRGAEHRSPLGPNHHLAKLLGMDGLSFERYGFLRGGRGRRGEKDRKDYGDARRKASVFVHTDIVGGGGEILRFFSSTASTDTSGNV